MMRLRKNLQPRVSNNLAVLSAVLLLVCYVVGTGDEMRSYDRSSNFPALVQLETQGPEQPGVDGQKIAVRKGLNISLMIFRHN